MSHLKCECGCLHRKRSASEVGEESVNVGYPLSHFLCTSFTSTPVSVWTGSELDPPENCHLNVKKLPKTWHFWQFSGGSGSNGKDKSICQNLEYEYLILKEKGLKKCSLSTRILSLLQFILGYILKVIMTFKIWNSNRYQEWTSYTKKNHIYTHLKKFLRPRH